MKRLLGATALLAALSMAPAQEITPEQLEKYLENKQVFFLDVRQPEEIKQHGSVPGYVNIPVGDLEKRMNELPKEKVIVTL